MSKASGSVSAPVRYAVRQVLDQELRKQCLLQDTVARHARSSSLNKENSDTFQDDDDKENSGPKQKADVETKILSGVKRDFFGRIINEVRPTSRGKNGQPQKTHLTKQGAKSIWVSYHEGYSNAVRKPVTLKELMESFEL